MSAIKPYQIVILQSIWPFPNDAAHWTYHNRHVGHRRAADEVMHDSRTTSIRRRRFDRSVLSLLLPQEGNHRARSIDAPSDRGLAIVYMLKLKLRRFPHGF